MCAGSGGVGKTTTAAALAMGMAERGHKVAVVTIDPARRLADSLGLEELGNEPRLVDPALFSEHGVKIEGELWALMLDSKRTGGTFTEYEAAVEATRRSADADVRNADQLLKREKRQMQRARERAAKRSSTAARNVKNAGLPKIVAGKLKRDAQESAAKADDVHSRRVDDARARLDEAERALRDDDAIVLDLPDTDVPAGRTVLAARGLQMCVGGRELYAGNGMTWTSVGPNTSR